MGYHRQNVGGRQTGIKIPVDKHEHNLLDNEYRCRYHIAKKKLKEIKLHLSQRFPFNLQR